MKQSHVLLLVFLLTSIAVSAQRNYTVHLSSGDINPVANITKPTIDSFNKISVGKPILVLLQFERIPEESIRKVLGGSGITLLDYIPQNTYTASVSGPLQLSLLLQAGVRSLIPLTAAMKVHEALKQEPFPSWAVKNAGTVDILISFSKTFFLPDVLNDLRKNNFDIVNTDYGSYCILTIRAASDRILDVASLPYIEYVQPAPPAPHPLNSNSRASMGANVLGAGTSIGGRSLDGTGVVAGIGDNANVQTHLDFANRLIDRSYGQSAGHGHHVTGTVAGAGNIESLYTGFAPNATIVSVVDENIIRNAGTYVSDFGMVLSNNSYGRVVSDCNYAGFYDPYARIVDQQAFDYPNLETIFAAGNDGGLSCWSLPAGFRTVVGGYQTAKNVLTVGATRFDGIISIFSSKGPVKDGRIKPEIAAMGEFVASAWPTNIYSYNNGTSMAAPAVTGGLALLYQRYKQLNGGSNPKNGLMKAILCNSATDKGNYGPDYSYGFGWMNLVRGVDILENNHYFTNNVTNGSIATHTISVPANTAQLKVLLYWNDPAAALLSSQALVNDLDLEVADPSGATVLPKILNPSNVTATATSGVDHLNNMEQVLLDNPVSGTYTIRVKGTTIAQNPLQEYFIAYDAVPVSLKIKSPFGGETWVPSTSYLDSALVSWDAFGNTTSTYTVEFSADNGNTWSAIATNLSPETRHFRWYVPVIATDKARIRVIQNATGAISASSLFTIMQVPSISLAPVQCEGYISVNWTSVPGATDYEVMLLQNGTMVPAGITTGNTFSIGGLSKDSLYAVSVRARINGQIGRRAYAVLRQPNNGTCSGSLSDNDLKLDALEAPVSGRIYTSTQLSANTAIKVRIKNLDDAAISNFQVSYSVNGGTWITENVATTINANSTYTHTFSTTQNLSAAGSYQIRAAVYYSADGVRRNDTLVTTVRQLDNQPISLTNFFVENFDAAPIQEFRTSVTGLNGLDRFDFSNSTNFGRVRSFINTGIAYSGNRALTLDADRFLYPSSNINYLYGTFNLTGYNTNTNDVRLDFRYNSHEQIANPNNSVWIRGSENDPWINAYDLYANQLASGIYRKSHSIELAHLLAAAGQSFTSSFQVRWGQHGYFAASDRENAAGYSFDDIRLYLAFNDMQMLKLEAPADLSCGLSATTTVKVTVRNSSNNALTNIPVKYKVDGSNWVSETIASIPAQTTIQYSFTTPANLSAFGAHTIDALVDYIGDSFRDNDTITTIVNNLPVISSFPYLQNFEANNGYWYAGGKNNSWEYGTPGSVRINRAASGAKAWKTRLIGNYNDNELSYLYSPCFDVSTLLKPTLSFSVAMDIEDCGSTLCDAAWMEYSTDGISWTKLGSNGIGTNWYNKATDQVWSVEGYTRYHVATIPLPTTNNNRIRFRFVLASDPGVTKEGLAIDDIHVYDNINGIYDGSTMTSPITQNASGSNWVHYLSGNKLVASIAANNQSLGNTDVQAFIFQSNNTNGIRNNGSQYYHDRNLVIKSDNALTDSIGIRFYFLDSETDSLIFAKGCNGCAKPGSAYELGISKYTDPVRSREDGIITNDTAGNWQFFPLLKVSKVPFDKGYYSEFKVRDLSELWLTVQNLNRGQLTFIDFTATKSNGNNVLLQWNTVQEVNLNKFEVEVARSTADYQNNSFIKIGETAARNIITQQQYNFTDIEPGKTGVRYYRLKIIDIDGHISYSPIRSVLFNDITEWQLMPNPSRGLFFLQAQVATGDLITATVTDAASRLVQSLNYIGTGQLQKFDINLAGQAAGVYLLQVNYRNERKSFKLYKQ